MSQLSLTPARKAMVIAGALIVAATWIYLVLLRPTDWESVAGSTEALITLAGYLVGAALLLAGTVPALPARTIAIIPVALVLNIVVGEIIGSIGVPLYIDSVGTILVAALAGPIAGLATGTLSSVVWGLLNPAALPFAAVSAATGFLSGLVIKKGASLRCGGSFSAAPSSESFPACSPHQWRPLFMAVPQVLVRARLFRSSEN